jgi:L-alanine-DL-glutamate epimerase-like enolase superfamily enzyme
MFRTVAARHDVHPLRAPFRIARGSKIAADVVTVSVTQGSHVGRGEGVPYARYGETIADSLAALASVVSLVEQGAGRAEVAQALPPGAARNALDAALWDLEARVAGTSVAALAGLATPAPVASAITIAIDMPQAMAAVAARHARAPLLKVKVDRTAPEAQIAAVRAAAPDARLIVDPNESWSSADLVGLDAFLMAQRVDLLEQPLPADDDGALATRRPSVPVCADESLHTVDDLDRLVGRYTHVNVKLDKAGGLTAALALARAAEARGFGLMVGCMVCSSLGIAPALLLAGGAAFVDLDGPLWLSDDYAAGVRDHDGVLAPPSAGFWGGG